ncbi:MAG: hypothetical protein BM562_07430 [Alphaproteobacteria bacterium MedPE-SWcel]|nr:MAG: hypothetical protein BM562_07430 [Alphaproteobacteria bacterium MedPE-SWcel]
MPDRDFQLDLLPATLIRRLNQFAVARFMTRMAEAGLDLTPVQYSALAALHAHPGVDQATLAGLIGYDRATLGKVVGRLEAKALLQRQIPAHDRRARSLHLTPEGEALLADAQPLVELLQPEIFAGLNSAEKSRVINLLRKLVRSMERGDHDAPPMSPAPDSPAPGSPAPDSPRLRSTASRQRGR